jgi:hypothetical protein
MPFTGFPWPAAPNPGGASGFRKHGKEREKALRIARWRVTRKFKMSSLLAVMVMLNRGERSAMRPGPLRPRLSSRGGPAVACVFPYRNRIFRLRVYVHD